MVHKHKKVTHPRVVCDEKPEKDKVNRVRITAQGQSLDYIGDTATETAGLTTAKILFNSVVSTPDAKFMTPDISNVHLNTHLKDCQHMKFRLDVVPQETIDQCKLLNVVDKDSWVCCEIRKAVCGLKESGKLANMQLKKSLPKLIAVHAASPMVSVITNVAQLHVHLLLTTLPQNTPMNAMPNTCMAFSLPNIP